MTVRRMTWAEFNAWAAVNARVERQRRVVQLTDTFQAARGEIDDFNKLVEKLSGDR